MNRHVDSQVACSEHKGRMLRRWIESTKSKKHLKKSCGVSKLLGLPQIANKNTSFNILEQNLKTLKNIFRGISGPRSLKYTQLAVVAIVVNQVWLSPLSPVSRRPTKSIKSIQSIHIQSSKSLIALQYSCHGAMGLQTQGEEFRRDLALIVTIMF